MDLMLIASGFITGIAGFMSGFGSAKRDYPPTSVPLGHIENRLVELESYLSNQEKMLKKQICRKPFNNRPILGWWATRHLILTRALIKYCVRYSWINSFIVFTNSAKIQTHLKSARARSRATELKNILRTARDSHNEIKLRFEGQTKS